MSQQAADELRGTFERVSRAHVAEIPAEQAENAGWPERAMPRMLAALGLTEAPIFAWFVNATNPLYDSAVSDGWRDCFISDDPEKPVLSGIAYGGPPPRVYLRADMSLPLTLRTLGHELRHVWEFAHGEPADEKAADEFGAQSTARFLASLYR